MFMKNFLPKFLVEDVPEEVDENSGSLAKIIYYNDHNELVERLKVICSEATKIFNELEKRGFIENS